MGPNKCKESTHVSHLFDDDDLRTRFWGRPRPFHMLRSLGVLNISQVLPHPLITWLNSIFFVFLAFVRGLWNLCNFTYVFFWRVYLPIKIWSLCSAKGQFIKSHFAYRKKGWCLFTKNVLTILSECLPTHLPNKNWQLHMQSRMNLKSSLAPNTLVMTIADFQLMMAILWKCFEGPLVVVEVSFRLSLVYISKLLESWNVDDEEKE